MNRLFAALVFVGAGCFGADLSGNWTGKADLTMNDERSTVPVFMSLKQDGATVTGTAGETKSEQHPIQNGKVEGDTLTFQIKWNEDEDTPLMTLRLTLKNGHLVGTAKGHTDDGDADATLDLERER
jgi:hypothetical protein